MKKPCPQCGENTLSLEVRWQSRLPGTFSLSGVQTKTVATPRAVLSCGACTWSVDGRLEGVETDPDGTITGGHLVADTKESL